MTSSHGTYRIKFSKLIFGIYEKRGSKSSPVVLGKGLSLALIRDLNERALTLLKKDLDIVVHDGKEKTEETGLERIELSSRVKSAWFNLKDTAIL